MAGAATDTVKEIARALWPAGGKEKALRERIAALSGMSTGHAALELLALRDYAFQMVSRRKFGTIPEETDLGHGVYALIDSVIDDPGVAAAVEAWATARTGYAPTPGQPEEWRELLRHIGAEFEKNFGKSGTALALIGAAEFDSALSRIQELCEIAAPNPPEVPY